MTASDDRPRADDDHQPSLLHASSRQRETGVPDTAEAIALQTAVPEVWADSKDTVQRPTFRGLMSIAEFRALIIGFLLFLTSSTIGSLVISILVYEGTHSPLLSAIALAANYLPHVIGATFLLSLADRMPARRGLTLVSLVQVLTLVSVALGVLPVGGVLVIVLLAGVARPIGTAIRSAALTEILGDSRAQYVLGRAVLNMTSYSGQALGFATGGVFVVAVGARAALWVAAAGSFVVIVVNWFGLKDRPARASATGSAFRQTWETNRLLLRTRATRRLLLFLWLPLTLASGAGALFVPFAARNGGASLASAFFWAVAVGSFVGDLLVGRLASPARQARLVLPLALLLATPLICFAANPPTVIAVGLCFISATGASYHLGLQGHFLDKVPLRARAQAFGLMYSGITALQGVAYLLAGAIATVVAPGRVIAIFGIASAVCSIALAPYIRARSGP